MAKKLKKGKALTELVKGSLNYTMQQIRDAFRRQFPSQGDVSDPYIDEIFADHVIVSDYEAKLKADEYFMVTYEKAGDSYTFAARDQWEVVELAYQPQTGESGQPAAVSEKKKKGKGQRFEERIECEAVLEEAQEGKPRRVRYEKAMTADIVNGNDRRYPAQVLKAAIEELGEHLHESAGQGRAIQLLGEAEHPSDKSTRRPNLLETVTKWEQVDFDGQDVTLTGRILETSKGKDILTLMEGGVMPGVSMRGYGDGKNVKVTEDGGQKIEIFEVSELHITGFDLVLEPSFENVAELIESMSGANPEEEEMSEELLTKLQVQEQEKAALSKQLEEANKAIEEGKKAGQELAELKEKEAKAERLASVGKAIEEATKELPYGEEGNKLFVEEIAVYDIETAEHVKEVVEAMRKRYDKLFAGRKLEGMGFNGQIGGIAPVFEKETDESSEDVTPPPRPPPMPTPASP